MTTPFEPPANPVLVHVVRGTHVESFVRHLIVSVSDSVCGDAACTTQHRGAYCVVRGTQIIERVGDISRGIYPRSAAKALQALAVFDSGAPRSGCARIENSKETCDSPKGAVDKFKLTDEQVAVLCSSHNGEDEHVRVVQSILDKIGLDESAYLCGAHWPYEMKTHHKLIETKGEKRPIHNNVRRDIDRSISVSSLKTSCAQVFGQARRHAGDLRDAGHRPQGLHQSDASCAEANCNVRWQTSTLRTHG